MAMAEKMLTPRRSYGTIRITKIRTVKSIIISQSKEAIAITWIPGSTVISPEYLEKLLYNHVYYPWIQNLM